MTTPRPLARWQPGQSLTPRPWQVTTTIGNTRTTQQLHATTAAEAILAGLELAGPQAQLVACLREGEWA